MLHEKDRKDMRTVTNPAKKMHLHHISTYDVAATAHDVAATVLRIAGQTAITLHRIHILPQATRRTCDKEPHQAKLDYD